MQKSKEEMAEEYDLHHAEHLDDSEKIAFLAGYSAAQDELTALKAEMADYREALISMHIDDAGWNLDNPENVTYEIAIGWHKSNNEKIESVLAKHDKHKGE